LENPPGPEPDTWPTTSPHRAAHMTTLSRTPLAPTSMAHQSAPLRHSVLPTCGPHQSGRSSSSRGCAVTTSTRDPRAGPGLPRRGDKTPGLFVVLPCATHVLKLCAALITMYRYRHLRGRAEKEFAAVTAIRPGSHRGGSRQGLCEFA
jgi:hypothetical protein